MSHYPHELMNRHFLDESIYIFNNAQKLDSFIFMLKF